MKELAAAKQKRRRLQAKNPRIERLKDYLSTRKRLEKRFEALRQELLDLQRHLLVWQGLVPASVLSQGRVVFHPPDDVYCAEHDEIVKNCACRDREPTDFDLEYDQYLMDALSNPPSQSRRKGQPRKRALDFLVRGIMSKLIAEGSQMPKPFDFLHNVLVYCFDIHDESAETLKKRWDRYRQDAKEHGINMLALLKRRATHT